MFRSSETKKSVVRHAGFSQLAIGERIIVSGPHINPTALVRVEMGLRKEQRHHADRSDPTGAGPIDGHQYLEIGPVLPGMKLVGEKQVIGCSGPVQEDNPAVVGAVPEDMINRWPERGQPDAAGDENHVVPAGSLHRPGRAERPAQATPSPGRSLSSATVTDPTVRMVC